MADAPARWSARSDRGLERGDGESRVDGPTDRVADHAARPGVEDEGGVDEPGRDGDVGDVAVPELVGTVGHDLPGEIREHRQVMGAVGRGDKASAPSGLQVVFTHQPTYLLAVDDDPLLPQGSAYAAVPVRLELVADRLHATDDLRLVHRDARRVVEGRAWETHQAASLGDGQSTGPATTDVRALLGDAAFF